MSGGGARAIALGPLACPARAALSFVT